jgi:spore coat polysaccharide biosynthesis predicted glycosyltransferase SpsG
MPAAAHFRVIFAAAAGPTIGFGHLVRCRSLARALGVEPLVSVRGTARTRRRAAAGGWRLATVRNDEDLRRLDLHVLVVDDPSITAVRTWVGRARRVGVAVATIHDLAIAAIDSDLVIDGSVKSPRGLDGRFGSLRGLLYTILDPRVRTTRERLTRPRPRRVLVALGGGRRLATAARLVRAIAARVGDADIRVAGGFSVGRAMPALATGTWIHAQDGLAEELASASVAVLAGGVTLYEACALGVPSVAVALTSAQHVTIRALARRGATVDAGCVASGFGRKRNAAARTLDRVAREVDRLVGDPASRRRMATAGRRLVDGRGAARVAARLRQLPAEVVGNVGHVA